MVFSSLQEHCLVVKSEVTRQGGMALVPTVFGHSFWISEKVRETSVQRVSVFLQGVRLQTEMGRTDKFIFHQSCDGTCCIWLHSGANVHQLTVALGFFLICFSLLLRKDLHFDLATVGTVPFWLQSVCCEIEHVFWRRSCFLETVEQIRDHPSSLPSTLSTSSVLLITYNKMLLCHPRHRTMERSQSNGLSHCAGSEKECQWAQRDHGWLPHVSVDSPFVLLMATVSLVTPRYAH